MLQHGNVITFTCLQKSDMLPIESASLFVHSGRAVCDAEEELGDVRGE